MVRFVRLMSMLVWIPLLVSCGGPSAPLAHDAYVWQRQWTPALRDAMAASRDLIRDWRVLVAQADRDGAFHVFSPDKDALSRSGRPVILVVRIDGRLARFDSGALVARVGELAAAWPQAAGIEIDYDCPTARLPAYTAFLVELKHRLGDLPLSITALPTWNGSPRLDALLAVPDESVLQVHAVQAPQAGLFDPDVAARWIDDFASHTHKPFRVALPTYGSRVSWNGDGALLAVESEVATLAAGATSAELYASPSTVLDFLHQLDAHRPKGLVGIVWFRLPTGDDSRAWSLATWRGVVRGRLDLRPARVSLRPASTPGAASDVIIENPGDVDVVPPTVVVLPAPCEVADGIDGYALRRTANALQLVASQARPLPAHARRAIGWARCKPGAPMSLSSPAQGRPLS